MRGGAIFFPNHFSEMKGPKQTTLVLRSALFFIFVSVVCSQSLPPAKLDGFLYGTKHRVDFDAIAIEAFFDPVCPDSRDSWPPLKRALAHFGDRVYLVVHLLPLPYHDNAFAASRAIHIVNNKNTSATFHLLESFFNYQTRFYNAQTSHLSRTAVVNEIVKFASAAVGEPYFDTLQSGFNDRNTDLKTRISFKYSASRGVYATPTFFINGFQLPDSNSTLDFNGWKTAIDSLLGVKPHKNEGNLHFFL